MNSKQKLLVALAGTALSLCSLPANLPSQVLANQVIDVDLRSTVLMNMPIQIASINYETPPDPGGNPTGTGGTGGRTTGPCNTTTLVNLTLLVPQSHFAKTTSEHPTFLWYLSANVSVPVKFTLSEPKVSKPIFEKQIENLKAGITQLEIPQNVPNLVPGRQYKWAVKLICNPNKPADDLVEDSPFDTVSSTPELKQQLANAKSDQEKAAIYAKAGLWYDALASIWAAHKANPKNESIREDFLLLLHQGGLTEVEAQERQKLPKP